MQAVNDVYDRKPGYKMVLENKFYADVRNKGSTAWIPLKEMRRYLGAGFMNAYYVARLDRNVDLNKMKFYHYIDSSKPLPNGWRLPSAGGET
jgi:hypothetical protein